MRCISLFLFTLLLLLPACKKKPTTDSPSNILPKVQKEAALPTEQIPTHPGTFSPAAEPLGTDKIAHFGVKITFTLPADADFFEVAICDKAHPTVCSPTQDQPGIFSGSAPVIIPNPLGVTRSTTADLDVKIRVCKVQSPSAQPDSLRKALLCADWQSYAAYQVQPTSDPATAALYEIRGRLSKTTSPIERHLQLASIPCRCL